MPNFENVPSGGNEAVPPEGEISREINGDRGHKSFEAYRLERLKEINRTLAELNACNKYNTRGNCFTGLPVGPVGNPGLSSLDAVFEPSVHDNYYFVDDCNGKNYLNKTLSGHEKTIRDLKAAGLWCTN